MEEQPFPKEITYMDTAFNALVYLDVIYVFIVISCLTLYKMKIEIAINTTLGYTVIYFRVT